jgi:hypothetical protein
MLRIRGDRRSLLAALTAEWAQRVLQLPLQTSRPTPSTIRRIRSR